MYGKRNINCTFSNTATPQICRVKRNYLTLNSHTNPKHP